MALELAWETAKVESMGDRLKVKNAKKRETASKKNPITQRNFPALTWNRTQHVTNSSRPRHCYEAPRWFSARVPSCSTWSVVSTAACHWTGSCHREPCGTLAEQCTRCWQSRCSPLQRCGEDAFVCIRRTWTQIKHTICYYSLLRSESLIY